ncbi:MAG: SURF1 family cytochrome oxidase biogenesis protein [Croceibacterium sp.]
MDRRIPVLATLLVVAAAATMVALGVWQLQRLQWKNALVARYAQAQTMSASVPWPRDPAALEQSLFRWSEFDCQRVLGIRSGSGTSITGDKGWRHIAKCALPGGGEAEVALGYSREPLPPTWQGGKVSGVIAPGGVLMAAKPVPPLTPLAPPDPNDIPNNHLAYAVQWFIFALTALMIYTLALRKKWRQDAPR